MGTWQLFVDETGDFSSTEDLAIAGVLFEGYADAQLAISLRRMLERIFVGVPYPPHAAHHNVPAALLWAPLRDEARLYESRFTRRTAAALNLARRSTAREAVDFRTAVEASTSLRRMDFFALQSFDRWLGRSDPMCRAELSAETEQHRADFVDFLTNDFAAQMGSRALALVGAWRPGALPGAPSNPSSDDEYVALYEALLERALAFVAPRDGKSQVWIHVAPRGWGPGSSGSHRLDAALAGALQHPLLQRAAQRPSVTRAPVHEYNEQVHPGIVLADFAANRLRSRVLAPAKGWSGVMASAQTTIGLGVSAWCDLVPRPGALPAITATGIVRDAVRLAASGDHTGTLSGAGWATEQARAWIEALRG